MKIIYSLVMLTTLSFSSQAQNNKIVVKSKLITQKTTSSAVFKPQKEIISNWDTLSNTWNQTDSVIYSYTPIGNVNSMIDYDIQTGSFKNKEVNTYSANQKLTNNIQQWWNGSGWQNSTQSNYTYNSNDLVLTSIIQTYSINTWQNLMLESYLYNGSQQVIGITTQQWNSATHVWENLSKEDYLLNSVGAPTLATISTWTNNAWVQITTVNNITWYQWNSNFNESKVGGYTTQMWNGSAWVNNQKYTGSFDFNGNIVNELIERWNGTTFVHNLESATQYQYDTNNSISQSVDKNWVNHLNGLRNTTKHDYSRFVATTAGLNNLVSNNTLFIYPNPAKDFAVVGVQLNTASSVEISIYDMTGKLVYSNTAQVDAGHKELTVNTSDFASGTYNVIVKTEKGTFKDKLSVVK